MRPSATPSRATSDGRRPGGAIITKEGIAIADPFLDAAAELLDEALGDLDTAIAGAPAAALNWQPASDGTNSLAVLATHAMASTRAWLSIATGAALPARDRPSEFRATVEGLGELTAYIAGMADDCRALLAAAAVDDWSRTRATPAGPDGTAGSVAAAWALLHAMEHLREHTGQMLLTRQLWERQAAG